VAECAVVTVGMIVALRAVTLGSDGEGLSKRTLHEIKVLNQLRHPHVIRLLEIIRDKNGDLAHNYTTRAG